MIPLTFINEHAAEAFPFLPDATVPFPASCIRDIQLCLRDGALTANSIVVSGVTIMDDAISVSLSGSITGYTGPLARLTSYFSTPETSELTLIKDVDISGFMEINPGNNYAVGDYPCQLSLDPRCICIMRSSEFGWLSSIKGYDGVYAVGQCLNISFGGLFKCAHESNANITVTATDVTDRRTMLNYDIERIHHFVTSVAGCSYSQSAAVPHTLIIASKNPDIKLTVDGIASSYADTGVVSLRVHASGDFPSCLTADDAAITDENLVEVV